MGSWGCGLGHLRRRRGSWGGVPRGRPASLSAVIAACSCERREKALTREAQLAGGAGLRRGTRVGDAGCGRKAGRGGAGARWSGPLGADRARTGPKECAAAERRAGLGHGGKLGRGLRKEMERVGPAGLGWVGSWVLGGFRGLLFSFSISNSNKSI